MSLLGDLGLWLQAGGVGTLAATSGTSIMLGGVVDTPNRMVGLIEVPGLTPIHFGGGKLIRPRVRGICRDVGYEEARALGQAVADRLDQVVNMELGPVGDRSFYQRVEAETEPFDGGVDPDGRFLMVVDLTVTRDG